MTTIEDGATAPITPLLDPPVARPRPAPKPLRGLTGWVRGWLTAFIAMAALYIIVTWVLAITVVPDPLWSLYLIAHDVDIYLGLILMVSYLVAGIMFLRWTFRAMRNLHLVRAEVDMAAGWAVGWYFIPVASLWMPFSGMSEIWRGSQNPKMAADLKTPALLRWWWTAFLISFFGGNAVERALIRVEEGTLLAGEGAWTALRTLYFSRSVADMFAIVSASLLAVIVARVSRMQEQTVFAARENVAAPS